MGEVVPAWLGGDPAALRGYVRAVADGVAAFRTQSAAIYGRERRFAGDVFWAAMGGCVTATFNIASADVQPPLARKSV